MTWSPILGVVPQITAEGEQASGYVLKFYDVGTTTPRAVSTNSTGTPTTTDFLCDSEGYTTLSGVQVIPHVDSSYKVVLYLNQTDADNDATGSAVWSEDNITLSGDTSALLPIIAQYASNGDFFTDSGSANTVILTVISPKTASAGYVDGESIVFYPNANGTGAATVNRDGLGQKDLKDENGNSLSSGDLSTTSLFQARYSLANDEFRRVPTLSQSIQANLKTNDSNYFTNGDHQVHDRGLAFASIADGSYMSNEWKYDSTVDGGTLVNNAATVTPFALGQTDVPNNPANYLAFTGYTTSGGNSYLNGVSQYIRGVTSLSNQICTLSFWIKGTASGTVGHYIEQNYGSGGSPSSSTNAYSMQDVAITTSWQEVSYTFTMPSVSGKTLGSASDDHLRFRIVTGAGSTTASGFGGSVKNYLNEVDITGARLRRGAINTTYEPEPYETVLYNCRQYLRPISTYFGVTTSGYDSNQKLRTDAHSISPQMIGSISLTGTPSVVLQNDQVVTRSTTITSISNSGDGNLERYELIDTGASYVADITAVNFSGDVFLTTEL